MKILLLIAVVFALPAGAADWALRDTDHVLSQAEVDTLTAGRTIEFFDHGRSKYSTGGAYSYTYASGESAFGSYKVAQDGTVCIEYRDGNSRCDRYVRNGDRIVLLTENGLRFPIRPLDKN